MPSRSSPGRHESERAALRSKRSSRLAAFAWIAFLGCGAALACAPLEVEPEPVERPVAPLSVEAAVQLALRNHPDVRIAREHLLQAAAAIDEAWSLFWPEVSIGTRFDRTNAPSQVFGKLLDQGEFTTGIDFNDPGTRSNVRAAAGASLLIYDGGRRRARLLRSESLLGASVSNEERVRARIAFETASAWYRVHAARAAAVAVASQEPARQELLAEAEAERASGSALPIRVEELRLQVSSARRAAETARMAARKARSALVLLLGLGVTEAVELEDPVELSELELAPLPQALERARFARPAVVGAQHAIDAALAGLREAEAGYLPELTLEAAFGFDDEDPRLARSNWLFGIGLLESLTDALRTPHRVRRAASALRVAHEAGRRTLLAVEQEVEAAWLDAEEAQRALEHARRQKAWAESALRRTEAERELGAARATELTWARLEAEVASAQELIHELRNAEARVALAHAMGTYPANNRDDEDIQP